MSRVTLEKRLYLEPKDINSRIKDNIRAKINGLVGSCTQEFGYIVEVYDGIQILGNIIPTSDPGSFVTVKFEAKTLKPEAGSVYSGEVCMIFQDGIFVEVAGKMKVLLPASKLLGYEYRKDSGTFVSKIKTIGKGDQLKVKIDFVKYEKGKYGCIGSLL